MHSIRNYQQFVVCDFCQRHKEWTGVDWSCCLIVFAIVNWVQSVRTVMGFQWWWMVISGEVLDCIDCHSNVYPTFAIVPLEIDAAVEIAGPILNIAQKRGV